jgi:class 3 adenylate cyclase
MLFAIIFRLMLAGQALASSPVTVTSPDALPLELSLVDYIIDEEQKLTFDEVLKLEPSKWSLAADKAFEMPIASVWLHFTIESKIGMPTLIEHRWNLPIDGATLYRRAGGGWAAIKPMRSFAPLFAVELVRGRQEFYLHLQNCRTLLMKSRLLVSSAYAVQADQYSGRDFIALLFGVTIALVMQNLGWFLFYRRAYFIFYVTYSLSTLGILAIASFHLPNFHQRLWVSLLWANAASVFLFMATALSLKRFTPKIFFAMVGLLVATTVFMGAEIAWGRLMPWYLPQIGLYIASIGAAIVRQRQGYKPATFFVAGWSMLTIGCLINAQAYTGHVPLILRFALYAAFAAESVFFAFAVGFKARISEAKATAENTHAFKQMEKVFYPHQIHQIREGSELENTMPTGAGEACVLCFDIVGSSKINHEKTKEFFRAVFRRCNEAMDEIYDPQTLIASGYRIKEMGDGFICSVGYPFKSPSGSLANDAYHLAQRFVSIFTEEVARFDYHEPLHCCIGLAMDSISGFYPAGGTKSYDLFGRSIVLANRYEAMRKVIIPEGLKGNLLILQERVYFSLDKGLRSGFVQYMLREHGAVVRDDPAADRLYYMEINAGEAERLTEMTKSA